MLANPLMARWDVVAATQHALRYGGASLRNVPGLLKRVIRETLWQEYLLPTGEVITFQHFAEFIGSQWGLDTTLAMLERICGKDMEALDLLDGVTHRLRGGQARNTNAASQRMPAPAPSQGSLLVDAPHPETNVDNVNIRSEQERPDGNSRTYALRRLRKARPDIHRRVLAGDISPHQGMIDAGFRHKPTPLDMLHRYWRQVEPDDRLRFLCEMLTPNERRAIQCGFVDVLP